MSIIRRIFRPGSGGATKGISIVDTQTTRAPVRNPRNFQTQEVESDPESSFYPYILSNEVSPLDDPPRGSLPGVDEAGRIPAYEPDDPNVLRRLFGIFMPDE